MMWMNEYPYEVNASVLLLDGKIYNWKIGNQHWETPNMVKMRFTDMHLISEGRFSTENKSFTVNNEKEHSEAFEIHAREWFKNWEISDVHIGIKCY